MCNVACSYICKSTIIISCVFRFFYKFFTLFLLLSNNSFIFLYQNFIAHYDLLQCMKIRRVKKKQLFTIEIMPIWHHYLSCPLMCHCTCEGFGIWNGKSCTTTCHWMFFIQFDLHRNISHLLHKSFINWYHRYHIHRLIQMFIFLIIHLNIFMSFPIHLFKSIYSLCFFI